VRAEVFPQSVSGAVRCRGGVLVGAWLCPTHRAPHRCSSLAQRRGAETSFDADEAAEWRRSRRYPLARFRCGRSASPKYARVLAKLKMDKVL